MIFREDLHVSFLSTLISPQESDVVGLHILNAEFANLYTKINSYITGNEMLLNQKIVQNTPRNYQNSYKSVLIWTSKASLQVIQTSFCNKYFYLDY